MSVALLKRMWHLPADGVRSIERENGALSRSLTKLPRKRLCFLIRICHLIDLIQTYYHSPTPRLD